MSRRRCKIKGLSFSKPEHKARKMKHDGWTYKDAIQHIEYRFPGMEDEDYEAVKRIFKKKEYMLKEVQRSNRKLEKDQRKLVILRRLFRRELVGWSNLCLTSLDRETIKDMLKRVEKEINKS